MNEVLRELPKPSKEKIEDYRLWFEAREIITDMKDDNFFNKALKLARQSKHEDAIWLCSLFPDGIDETWNIEDLVKVFYQVRDDRRASFFLSYLSGTLSRLFFRRESSRLGYSGTEVLFLSTSSMERKELSDKDSSKLACRLALDFEPEALYWLGDFMNLRRKSDPNFGQLSRQYMKLAAELGCKQAMFDYGHMLDGNDPERYYWLGKAAEKGLHLNKFLEIIPILLHTYTKDETWNRITFQIGKVIASYPISHESQRIFNYLCADIIYESINSVIKMYNDWCKSARKAIDCWMLISKKLPIHKDLRKVIAIYVWNMRSDADYIIDVKSV